MLPRAHNLLRRRTRKLQLQLQLQITITITIAHMRHFFIAITLEIKSQTSGKYTQTIGIFTRIQIVLHV